MTTEDSTPRARGPRVFVVQRPAFYSREREGWVNKYDISPARRFGELVYLLRPGNLYRDRLASALESLRRDLADFRSSDHILAIGDPIAIAAAVMTASAVSGGSVSMLKYDRMADKYDAYLLRVAAA